MAKWTGIVMGIQMDFGMSKTEGFFSCICFSFKLFKQVMPKVLTLSSSPSFGSVLLEESIL